MNTRDSRISFALFATVLGSIAVLFGLAASTGSPLIAFFMLAILLSAVLLVAPANLLVLVIFGGLVIAGVAELYLPSLRQARWGVALAATAVGVIAIVTLNKRVRSEAPPALKLFSATLWALAFFSITVVSGLLNKTATLDLVINLKNYFQVWGVLLAFALLPLRPRIVDRMVSLVFWLGFLQLPFVLHQHFFLVPQRMGAEAAGRAVVAQDILVGTFSGSLLGGGSGPAMAVLLLVAASIAVARYRIGQLSGSKAFISILIFMVPIAIGEHKISLVLLPIAFLLLYEDKIRLAPIKVLGYSAISISIVSILFIVIANLPRTGTTKSLTLHEYWDEMWSYNIGDRGYGRYALNRTSVYPFWLQHHQAGGGSILNTLIGHGPGASKDIRGSFVAHSLAADRYPMYGIGLTGISSLLWDVGLLGLVAVLAFFYALFRTARSLAKAIPVSSTNWPFTKGAEIGVALMAVSLFHNNMFLFEIGYQTLLMLLVGYVLYMKRIADNPSYVQAQLRP